MSNFNVYVIHSAKPLGELKGLLEACGGYVYAGIIYKSLRHKVPGHGVVTEKEETRKTIVFCPTNTIQQLELAYPQYKNRVADYNWESFPVPNLEQGETWDLHISGVPNDYTVNEAESFVTDALHCILPEKNADSTSNFVVEFSPRLRETGEIFGFGHITFSKDVDQKVIKLCKLILHNTPVNFKGHSTSDKRMVTCVWHRPPQIGAQQKKSDEHSIKRTYKLMQRPKSGMENVYRARPSMIQQVDVSNLNDETNSPSITTDGTVANH